MSKCTGYREREVTSKIFGKEIKHVCYCASKETKCGGDKTQCEYFPAIKEKALDDRRKHDQENMLSFHSNG